MEVLASLAAGLKGGAAEELAARDASKRYMCLRLTKAQIISSLLSLGDWVSDWVYAIQALAWAAGEYIMSATEELACVKHVGAHGPGEFDASGNWDGDESLGSGSWEGESANCTDVSLAVELCAAPRTVEIPGIVLGALFFAAGTGMLSDVAKGWTVYDRDLDAEEEAAHYAKKDKGELSNGPGHGCLGHHVEHLAKWHGRCSAGGVILEDTVQLVCTCWVEFVCKPDALVAPVGVGGISAVALLSLVFGLANALFKVVEGVVEARTGELHTIDTSSLRLL